VRLNAAPSSLIILLASMLATWLPRRSAVLYLPGVVLAAIILTSLAGFHSGGDDFPGRIAYTVELLSRNDLADFAGISSKSAVEEAVDSGIAYIIMTQSIIGLSVAWLFIILGAHEDRPEQIRYTHGLCIYLALALMVSASVFIIKTAALIWFVHGSLQGRQRGRSTSLRIVSTMQRCYHDVGRPTYRRCR
jgi:putative polymerase